MQKCEGRLNLLENVDALSHSLLVHLFLLLMCPSYDALVVVEIVTLLLFWMMRKSQNQKNCFVHHCEREMVNTMHRVVKSGLKAPFSSDEPNLSPQSGTKAPDLEDE